MKCAFEQYNCRAFALIEALCFRVGQLIPVYQFKKYSKVRKIKWIHWLVMENKTVFALFFLLFLCQLWQNTYCEFKSLFLEHFPIGNKRIIFILELLPMYLYVLCNQIPYVVDKECSLYLFFIHLNIAIVTSNQGVHLWILYCVVDIKYLNCISAWFPSWGETRK